MHRHRDKLTALPDTIRVAPIPPPVQPEERGVGMVTSTGSSSLHNNTPWALAAGLTPVLAGQEVISEEARVQIREQVRAHRRTGGVLEPSRASAVSQSVTAT